MELNGAGERYGFTESKILDMMFDYGFKTYSYSPFERKIINLDGKNIPEGNTLFIRNEDRILSRIKNAPKFTVYDMSL